jgi:hypothetical protein
MMRMWWMRRRRRRRMSMAMRKRRARWSQACLRVIQPQVRRVMTQKQRKRRARKNTSRRAQVADARASMANSPRLVREHRRQSLPAELSSSLARAAVLSSNV